MPACNRTSFVIVMYKELSNPHIFMRCAATTNDTVLRNRLTVAIQYKVENHLLRSNHNILFLSFTGLQTIWAYHTKGLHFSLEGHRGTSVVGTQRTLMTRAVLVTRAVDNA